MSQAFEIVKVVEELVGAEYMAEFSIDDRDEVAWKFMEDLEKKLNCSSTDWDSAMRILNHRWNREGCRTTVK